MLPNQMRPRLQQNAAPLRGLALDPHRAVKARARKIRQHPRVVRVRLVVLQAQNSMRLARVDDRHRQAATTKLPSQPGR
jgi:hypothetical protein